MVSLDKRLCGAKRLVVDQQRSPDFRQLRALEAKFPSQIILLPKAGDKLVVELFPSDFDPFGIGFDVDAGRGCDEGR